ARRNLPSAEQARRKCATLRSPSSHGLISIISALDRLPLLQSARRAAPVYGVRRARGVPPLAFARREKTTAGEKFSPAEGERRAQRARRANSPRRRVSRKDGPRGARPHAARRNGVSLRPGRFRARQKRRGEKPRRRKRAAFVIRAATNRA